LLVDPATIRPTSCSAASSPAVHANMKDRPLIRTLQAD